MSYELIQADARKLDMIADESVDLIVTSPPYFALRNYRDKCKICEDLGACGLDPKAVFADFSEHERVSHQLAGQIGSEATPQEFLEALWAVTEECKRVLKPSGSMFVNLGDKYVADNRGSGSDVKRGAAKHAPAGPAGFPQGFGRQKSLMLLPERYRIGCVDRLDLIARAVIVWCLSGGARVYARTPTGDRPIMLRDLYRHYRPEDVQLWNGEKWTQVLGWSQTPASGDALELELRSGERIGCTPNHQWPTDRGLLRADQIRVGDVLETTALPQREDTVLPLGLPDSDIGWLIGLYIAEGSRSGTTLQFAGHINETLRHARLAKIATAYHGTCNVYQTGENAATCNLTGPVLFGIVDRYVKPGSAKTKRLRAAAWQRSDEFLASVVEGYLSGDGHHDAKNDRWRLGFTENDEWAADLRTLAARLGCVLTLKRGKADGFGKTWPIWRGEWRWSADQVRLNRGEVVAVRRSRARYFYDVGVADDPHLFALASGVLTHNSKPNGLPESVTDRVRRSHEDWVHLTKEPRYFSAVDEIRAPHAAVSLARTQRNRFAPDLSQSGVGPPNTLDPTKACNPLGKLPGSVWTIATEPLRVPESLGVDHFAAYPQEWPRKLILGWSPSGICVECGEGRRPTVNREPSDWASRKAQGEPMRHGLSGAAASGAGGFKPLIGTITGYSCACPEPTAPTRPATILDPFCGTGTTVMVAHALGRHGIGVDLSADYIRLANWRIGESDHAKKTIERTYGKDAMKAWLRERKIQ